MAISTKHIKTVAAATAVKTAPASTSSFFGTVADRVRHPLQGKVKSAELIFFFTQLSLMIEIGSSLTAALRALAGQGKNPVFREALQAMLRDIEEGKQLSEAMRRHPGIFSMIYVSLVKAGETGGFLKKTLDSIVVMQERRQALITQLRSTMTYPAILCVMAIGVVVFVLVGILPKFAVLFAGKELLLPFSTHALMALSASLRGYWWAYVLVVLTFLLGGEALLKNPRGRFLLDLFLVRAPLVARLFNKILTCQLLRTLGHLLESHVPLIEALDVTRGTFTNQNFAAFVDQIREHVRGGGRFAYTFAGNPYVMETVKQMVATGEEVGNLPKVMLRLAEFYDTEIERDLKLVAALVEPLALVILGGVVGLIVSSVILPIFRIAGAIH